MFDSLHTVPWSQLTMILNKPATHLPQAIKDLCSADATTRSHAYWSIDNHVVVQSDLFEAAWYVVPFLLQIIENMPAYGREEAYDLLYEIGTGGAPADVTIVVDGTKVSLASACHTAVKRGWEFYIRDMDDAHPRIRNTALAILCSYKEEYPLLISILQHVYQQHPDPDYKQSIKGWMDALVED